MWNTWIKSVELNQVLKKYKKGQFDLENMLSKQRYFIDRYGLRYSKFDKPSTKKYIFVKTNNKFNNMESNKVEVEIHPKKAYVKNNSEVSKDTIF